MVTETLRVRAKGLLREARALTRTHAELTRRMGRDFNVFQSLQLQSVEVRGHSRFLAALLDPAGTHGQGFELPRRFFRFNWKNAVAERIFLAAESWRVRPEVWIGEAGQGRDRNRGFIDLVLETMGAERALLVIENKIYAGDQDRQLERYADWAKRENAEFELAYLTLDGRVPTPRSLGELDRGAVSLLSYEDHVLPWLDAFLAGVSRYPGLREVLFQYGELLNRLTTGGLSTELTMELADLLDDATGLEAATELGRALEAKRLEVQSRLWTALRAELGKTEAGEPESGDPSREELKKYTRAGRGKPTLHGLTYEVCSLGKGERLVLRAEVHNNHYIAVVTMRGEERLPMSADLRARLPGLLVGDEWTHRDDMSYRYPRDAHGSALHLDFRPGQEGWFALVSDSALTNLAASWASDIATTLVLLRHRLGD